MRKNIFFEANKTDRSKYIKNLVFLLIIVAGFIFLYVKRSLLTHFLNINFLEIVMLFGITLLGYLALAYSSNCLYKIFNINPQFHEWFGLTVCNTMLNYFVVAKGGTVAKAYYLNNRFGFKYSFYLSLITGAAVFGFAITAFLGLIAVTTKGLFNGEFHLSLFAIFVFFAASALLCVLFAKFLLKLKWRIKHKKLNQFFLNLKEGLSYFTSDKKHTSSFCFFLLLFIIIMALRLFLCFVSLDIKVNLLDILAIRTLVEFSSIISLLPGNLGIQEGIIVFTAGVFDISVDQALSAALLDRALSMVFVFSFGLVYSRVLLGKLKKSPG